MSPDSLKILQATVVVWIALILVQAACTIIARARGSRSKYERGTLLLLLVGVAPATLSTLARNTGLPVFTAEACAIMLFGLAVFILVRALRLREHPTSTEIVVLALVPFVATNFVWMMPSMIVLLCAMTTMLMIYATVVAIRGVSGSSALTR